MIKTIKKAHNYNMIDLCRFLGAYIVIACHANLFENFPNSIGEVLVREASEIVVPFYFVTTGFFLFIKMKDEKSEKIKKIDSYTNRIVKMYCIATLVSLPLTIYGYVVSGNNIISCILSYIKYFFFVGKLFNSYHLWYLLALIYALIVIRVMVSKNIKEEYIFIVALLVYTFFEVMWYAIADIDQLSGISYKLVSLFEYVFNKGNVFSGFIYVAIGILIAKYKKYLNIWACIIGIVVIYMFSPCLSDATNDYLRLVAVTLLYMGMLGISLPNHKCYARMRKMSMMVYLSHLIFLSIYTFLIINEPNKYGIDTFLVTSIASTIFAWIYCAKIKAVKQRKTGDS